MARKFEFQFTEDLQLVIDTIRETDYLGCYIPISRDSAANTLVRVTRRDGQIMDIIVCEEDHKPTSYIIYVYASSKDLNKESYITTSTVEKSDIARVITEWACI